MALTIEDFYEELFQEVHGTADAGEQYTEDSFFQIFCGHLVDAGELVTADRAHYVSPRGLRIDGYGGDPTETAGVLSLIIADFNPSHEISTLTATDMKAIFKRATNFLEKSLDERFRDSLEETTAAFGLADMIAARWPSTMKVRILLISNRRLSERVEGQEAIELRGIPVSYSIWDINRLHRFVTSGEGPEEIVIDLENDFGAGLPVLPAHIDDAGYEAYLAVVPGQQLADIYDRWSARLLEQNVRVFLQARGKVNKGLRISLENTPEMFFAYNNGITATAEGIETRSTDDGLVITKLHNMQVVNGGQTTASIHAASLKKTDLSRVFVQMKLSIIAPEDAIEVVPKISEYANTQNRVTAADFFANHPYHVRIENFSRRMYAPSQDGTFRESKWFYERARGQYQDARGNLTKAQRKKFDLEYPKRQMFTKTDLAKFSMVWRCMPHVVSKGAQKNFAEFAQIVEDEWEKNDDRFNELYYQHAIAKVIIFKATESLVSQAPWYEGGYRANIVAYAISKMAHDANEMKMTVDFSKIWRSQSVSVAMQNALAISARQIQQVLIETPAGIRNVTEWAKQQACWKRVKELEMGWPRVWINELVSQAESKQSERSAVKEQKILKGIEAQTAVFGAGAGFWRELHEWGQSRKLLTPTESGVLQVSSEIPNKVPTEKQSEIALQAFRKLQKEGCQLAMGE